MLNARPNLWGIVLAGGAEERLKEFIRAHLGSEAPRQFCTFLGHRTMVEATLRRASVAIPQQRLVLVGTEHQRHHLFRSLGDAAPGLVLLQPRGCDTAPGILLPLIHVLRQDPDATVAILPSDQFVRPGKKLMAMVSDAAAFLTDSASDHLILVGAEASHPETDYGWIEPGPFLKTSGGQTIRRIAGFVEKPTTERAVGLMSSGGLWNTMVMIARAASLWRLIQDCSPDLTGYFSLLHAAIGTDREQDVLNEVYHTLPRTNFSTAVLAHCPERLLVLPMSKVLWSDWGRGERIVDTLYRIKAPCLSASRPGETSRESHHADTMLTI